MTILTSSFLQRAFFYELVLFFTSRADCQFATSFPYLGLGAGVLMSFGRTDAGYTNELLFLDLTQMAWKQVRVCCLCLFWCLMAGIK